MNQQMLGAHLAPSSLLCLQASPSPSSTLAQHNVLEGSLLTLILTPPTRDDETMTGWVGGGVVP